MRATAGVPLMIHITDSPIPLPEILAEMAPGDIITHCYHGRANGIMGQEKQFVLKESSRRSATASSSTAPTAETISASR